MQRTGRRHQAVERGGEMTDLSLIFGIGLLFAIVVYVVVRPL